MNNLKMKLKTQLIIKIGLKFLISIYKLYLNLYFFKFNQKNLYHHLKQF